MGYGSESDRGALSDAASSRRRSPIDAPRWLLWSLVGLVAAGTLITVVTSSLRDPAPSAPATAEDVVRSYLQAVVDRDVATAREHLSQRVAERCTASSYHEAWVPNALDVTLVEVRPVGDAVEIEMRLSIPDAPARLGDGGHEAFKVFTLEEDAGRWWIAADPWPVQFACPQPRGWQGR